MVNAKNRMGADQHSISFPSAVSVPSGLSIVSTASVVSLVVVASVESVADVWSSSVHDRTSALHAIVSMDRRNEYKTGE